MMPATQETPDALLFIAPGCPHCPTVRAALETLLVQGLLRRLEIVDISAHPRRAEQLGVRAVPWLKLGDFELEGLHSPAELRRWATQANTVAGLGDYLSTLLARGRLTPATALVKRHPQGVAALLTLAEDPDTDLAVRIGVSAALEDLAGTAALLAQLPALRRLAASPDPRVRADACHFLALTESPAALPLLRRLAADRERAVSEVARDCLAELGDAPGT
jgi:glutaredoxin